MRRRRPADDLRHRRCAQTTVNYGRITAVNMVTQESARAQRTGALVGGGIGLATGSGQSGSNRALRTIGGGFAGQQIGRLTSNRQAFEYTVLLGGTSTITMITDEAGLRVGDCVAVERGRFNNLRLVDDARCAPPRAAPAPAPASAPAKAPPPPAASRDAVRQAEVLHRRQGPAPRGGDRRGVRPRGAARPAAVRRLKPVRCLALCAALGVLAGCGSLPRNAVPPELMAGGHAGRHARRARAGGPHQRGDHAGSRAVVRAGVRRGLSGGPDGHVRYAHLALSGGGANGAYGAGFLNGWTKAGTRPVFKIVTGVSTGALMAPFAFLGPEYDDALREFYTTTSSRNIFRMLSIVPQLLGGESLADTGPLQALIAQNVDEAFLRKIAQAHRSGRRLYVGTVDLDSQRFIVWNMGLIAVSGRQDALDMFRKVILASASMPIAFPPVFFDVEAGGRRYDEMHVDGAVAARVFYSGGVFTFSGAREGVGTRHGTRGHLRDPQRPAAAVRRGHAALVARHRAAGVRLGGQVRRRRRPVPHLRGDARRGRPLPLGDDSRRTWNSAATRRSTPSRWASSTTSATAMRSRARSGRPSRRDCAGRTARA